MSDHTAAELRKLPTLCVGQADDLKIERLADDLSPGYRVWLSRCTVADGEPVDNKVTIERQEARSGKWYTSQWYEG